MKQHLADFPIASSTYNNHGCRCSDCTRAWAEYVRERYWRRRGKLPPTTPKAERHGTVYRYRKGCHCKECDTAARLYRAKNRVRRKKKALADKLAG